MAGHRFVFQRVCTFAASPLKPFSHIGNTGNQPDLVPVVRIIFQFLYQQVEAFADSAVQAGVVRSFSLPHS